MKKYKYAFFDFDGVIVDSEPARMNSYEELINKKFNVNVKFSKKKMIGQSQECNIQNILTNNSLDSNQKVINEIILARSEILLDKARSGFPVIENTRYIIEQLKNNNIEMAVVSNSRIDYIRTALKGIHLDADCFQFVAGNNVSNAKPNPECYKRALNIFDCNSNEVLAFEDSHNGLKAAMSAGIDTVAVESSFEFNELKASYKLDADNNQSDIRNILSLFGIKYA